MPDTAPSAPRRLILIDGYSLLFRAFFAGRPLSTQDNRPTGALYGLANMMFSILNSEKPDAILVCWDASGPTLREQEFEAYKAHRPPVPDDLRSQFAGARELVTAFGIAAAEATGYEADDLIGTLATRGVAEGYAVTIYTGDSDQLQLVRDGVTVQMTQRGVSETKAYDAQAVQERYGIGPGQIADWKALVGDTSDNIPGVPGIGEKTATALLQQWNTLENLLDNVEKVTPPKARAALEANREQAPFSKRLATIICDVPGEYPIPPYAPTAENWQQLREMFQSLEFRSLIQRIPRQEGNAPLADREAFAPEAMFTGQAVLITSAEELTAALETVRQAGQMVVHLEIDGTAPMRAELRGIAFAAGAERGYYVSLRQGSTPSVEGLGGLFDAEEPTEDGEYRAALADFRLLLEDPAIPKAGHNVKVAEIVLERNGIHPSPFTFDTLIAAYLINAGRSAYPIMDLAEAYLGVRLEPNDSFALGENLAREAAVLSGLVAPMRERLAQDDLTKILETVEMPLIPVLAAIEEAGLQVDAAYLNTLSAQMATEIDALAQQVYALAGETFNIGSTKQLQTILFEKLQLPTGKKIKTGFSTGADLLEQLAPKYEIAQKIIDWRELAKLKATYTDALPKMVLPQTGRVHTSLNQAVATTGRLSSADPNLQNIPVRSEVGRQIRRAFVAPPGKLLLSCDYSQVELRLLAHVSRDATLMQAFQEDADIHAATAATVFGVPLSEVTSDQRRQAKTINFAVIYGQGGFALASTLGVDTATANQWIKDYFARLPGVQAYVEETKALAHRQKYVTTLLGRRRYLPELDSGNHNLRQFGERAAVNMPIQGTAADIMKLAMIAVQAMLLREWVGRCTLILQVHDELLFEVNESEVSAVIEPIRACMENAFPLDVRLKVDAKVGPSWAEMTPL